MIRSRERELVKSPALEASREDTSKERKPVGTGRGKYLAGTFLVGLLVVLFYYFPSTASSAPLSFSSASYVPLSFSSALNKYEQLKAQVQSMKVSDEEFKCPQSFVDQFPAQSLDTHGIPQRSWHGMKGEDKYLYQHFFSRKMSPGTFIEIGALDGLGLSNTFVFEQMLGWKGVLIEPQTKNYAELEVNRPNSTTLHGAVCLKPGILTIYGEGGQASQQYGSTRGASYALCEPMDALLSRTWIDRVDLYSIDVEGGELDLIISHDFERVPVFAVIVEMRDYESLRLLNQHVSNALFYRGFCRFAQNVGHYNEVWVNISYKIDLSPLN